MRFCFYRRFIFFLTTRPGAERGSNLTRGLFFLVLLVTWPRPLLAQVLVGTLDHATCNVYSPKAFETLIHENVTHFVFFIVCEIYFLSVLIEVFDSKQKNVSERARILSLVGK